MTRYYVPVPNEGGSEYLSPLLSRTKIPFIHADKAFEIVAYAGPEAETVISVPVSALRLLAAHGDELLTEMPIVILGVPDISYPTGWSTAATIFPSISFRDFEKKHLKSGHTQNDVQGLADPSKIVSSDQSSIEYISEDA